MPAEPPSGRDPVALAQALIRCPSVTPAEGGALVLLADVLERAGFEVHPVTFVEEGTADVHNLYARIGEGPALLLAGHTDVVPPGNVLRWSRGPFDGVVEAGQLYGRGAADMKGGIAAMVSAALRWRDAGGTGALAFLVTGDEEGPAINGTRKLLEWAIERGECFVGCVVGEPTNPETLGDMVKVGRRGSLSFTLVVEGVQGHVAYPQRARNPIRDLLTLATALTKDPLDQGSEAFDPSNLEPVSIDVGNPARNVIPGEATAVFNIRYNDRWTPETLEGHLRERLDGAALGGGTEAIRYRMTVEPRVSESFLTRPGPLVAAMVEAVRAETGREPVLSTSGGTSDARFIKDVCPVVEFGLVGRTMHQVDEHVAVADIETLTRIYGRVIEACCTGSAPAD